MSFIEDVLKDLWNATLYYKGVRVNGFGVPKIWEKRKKSYHSTVYRLHKNGLIDKKSGVWIVTKTGKKYLEQSEKILLNFDSPFKKESSKNLILMFDIPESRKKERGWLRKHLKKFEYFMIQKSVWVGPSPLPKDFVSYLKNIKLESYIKTFKLAKEYKIKR